MDAALPSWRGASKADPSAPLSSTSRSSDHSLTLHPNMGNARVPIPSHRPSGSSTSAPIPPSSTARPRTQSQTVVVQNPMSVDESGKLKLAVPCMTLFYVFSRGVFSAKSEASKPKLATEQQGLHWLCRILMSF
ncbi:hypothetical protein RJ640_021508 [Escallonia rubra]|uniref:Uncharacterized protein n=1 Tax=Escallonia rubra TaxID=112253 RepID=A0AA88QA07_9ASTE|nr:hypothetical protein RJ640_021508 [Escallonia rubra]